MKTVKISNFKNTIHLKQKYKFCIIDNENIYFVKNLCFHHKNYPFFTCQTFSYYSKNNGGLHNEKGPAFVFKNGDKDWYYNGQKYGINNDFTNKTWKKKVQELKREESFKIFK